MALTSHPPWERTECKRPGFHFLYYFKAPRVHCIQWSLPAPARLLLCRTWIKVAPFPMLRSSQPGSPNAMMAVVEGKIHTATVYGLNLVFQPQHSDNNQQPTSSKEPRGHRRKLRRERGHLIFWIKGKEDSILLLKADLKAVWKSWSHTLIHTHATYCCHKHTHVCMHTYTHVCMHTCTRIHSCMLSQTWMQTRCCVPFLVKCAHSGLRTSIVSMPFVWPTQQERVSQKQRRSWKEGCGPFHPHPSPVSAQENSILVEAGTGLSQFLPSDTWQSAWLDIQNSSPENQSISLIIIVSTAVCSHILK